MEASDISANDRHGMANVLLDNLRHLLLKCPANVFFERISELHRITGLWSCQYREDYYMPSTAMEATNMHPPMSSYQMVSTIPPSHMAPTSQMATETQMSSWFAPETVQNAMVSEFYPALSVSQAVPVSQAVTSDVLPSESRCQVATETEVGTRTEIVNISDLMPQPEVTIPPPEITSEPQTILCESFPAPGSGPAVPSGPETSHDISHASSSAPEDVQTSEPITESSPPNEPAPTPESLPCTRTSAAEEKNVKAEKPDEPASESLHSRNQPVADDSESDDSEMTVIDGNSSDSDNDNAPADSLSENSDSDYLPLKKKTSNRRTVAFYKKNKLMVVKREDDEEMDDEDEQSTRRRTRSFRTNCATKNGSRKNTYGSYTFKRRHLATGLSENGSYPCPYCPVRLKTNMLLRRHLKEYHSEDAGPRPCPVCRQIVTSSRRLSEHMKTKHPVENGAGSGTGNSSSSSTGELHRCHLCDQALPSVLQLSQHLVSYHTGNSRSSQQPSEKAPSSAPVTTPRKRGRPRKDRSTGDRNAADGPSSKLIRINTVVNSDVDAQSDNGCSSSTPSDRKPEKNASAVDSMDTPIGKAVFGDNPIRPRRGRPRKCDSEQQKDVSAAAAADGSADEGNGQFPCTFCDRILKTRMILNRHIREYHSEESGPRCCPLCPKVLTSLRRLIEHVKTHHGDDERNVDQVKCPVCKRVMPSALLDDHKDTCRAPKIRERPKKMPSKSTVKQDGTRSSDGNNDGLDASNDAADSEAFCCDLCDSRLKTKCLLRRHVREYHSATSGPRSCPMCRKVFSSARRLTEHLKCRHASDLALAGQFCCTLCNRVFLSEPGLSQHMKICHRTPTTCSICEEKLNGKLMLVQHMKLVHGLKYICPLCNKELGSEIVLRKHIKMHGKNGVRDRVVCEICANTFASPNSLKYHMLFKHSNVREFACTSCTQTFKVKEMLTRHVIHVHGKVREHLCSTCGRAFAQKHQLKTHMKVHRNDDKRISEDVPVNDVPTMPPVALLPPVLLPPVPLPPPILPARPMLNINPPITVAMLQDQQNLYTVTVL